MKKTLFFLLIFLCFRSGLFAQSAEKANEEKTGNYTIRVITNLDSSYGFELFEDQKLILRQTQKTFFTTTRGFNHRKTAIVVAKWYLEELKEGRNNIHRLVPSRAKELGISDDEFIYQPTNQ